jgi:hypothetical protein
LNDVDFFLNFRMGQFQDRTWNHAVEVASYWTSRNKQWQSTNIATKQNRHMNYNKNQSSAWGQSRIWMDIFACLNVLVEVKNLFQVWGSLNLCWMVTQMLHLILNSVLAMKTNWHLHMWESNWKSTSGSDMNENQSWKLVQILDLENRIDSLIENLYPILQIFVSVVGSFCRFFSLRAATLLLLLLPFSHCFYSFHVVAILLTWCCSFHMMK